MCRRTCGMCGTEFWMLNLNQIYEGISETYKCKFNIKGFVFKYNNII